MNVPVVLGMDLGTSSVKVSVVDAAGGQVGTGTASYGAASTGAASHGAASHGAAVAGAARRRDAAWWAAVRAATAQALAGLPAEVQGIGLSGQMHGVVALDAGGRVCYEPVLWNDTRGAPAVDRLAEIAAPFDDELLNALFPGLAAVAVYWLAQAEPDVLAAARWAVQPKDWLGLRLTGEISTDRSDASATGLWDFKRAGWHRGFCAAAGIDPGLLPPVLRGDEPRGLLREAAARDLGLRPGIPVAVGRADTAASMLGSGASLDPGQTVLTMGTGGQLCQVTAGPPVRPPGRVMTLAGPADDQHYAMAATYSAGMYLDWIRGLWSLSWADFADIAFSAAPCERGPLLIPFTRPSTPATGGGVPEARWTGLEAGSTRAELFLAAVEGVVYALRAAAGRLATHQAAVPVTSCTLVGGLARDERVRQLAADILGIPVRSPDIVSSSARGAAVSAAVVAGWHDTDLAAAEHFGGRVSTKDPDPGVAPVYDRKFALFTDAG